MAFLGCTRIDELGPELLIFDAAFELGRRAARDAAKGANRRRQFCARMNTCTVLIREGTYCTIGAAVM